MDDQLVSEHGLPFLIEDPSGDVVELFQPASA